ncbi:protein huluwa [Salminus brasiliensis]|uniref:protein huluwa n=1 Tax=Salminus brasiliensis TaxID=930266 RepID=UPI003B83A0D8
MPEPLVTATPSAELSGAALLVLALAPSALVLLLLLHCMLLGYKLLLLARRRKSARSQSQRQSQSPPSTRFSCGHARKATCFSSAPELGPPVTSSLASSAERRVRLLRPDGATYAGSASLRSWLRGSAPVLLLQSSGSEAERCNLVPPNSPEPLAANNGRASIPVRMMRRSSTMELELISLDKVHVEGEVISSIPQENSCFVASGSSSSAAGPGLDSDFGASAGVSLRILSADSDGFPGGAWASGLEWDYYDPSYVTQNHVPKHRHHAPPITIKQYWV